MSETPERDHPSLLRELRDAALLEESAHYLGVALERSPIAAGLLAAIRSIAPELTASCGIVLYGPDRPGDPDGLLAAADLAMYAAKAQGRDRTALATTL